MNMIGMIDLPIEVLMQILSFNLDYRSLVRCTQVCKSLRSIIQQSDFLLYLIELDAAGLVDNPDCLMPACERLKACQRLRLSWGGSSPVAVDMYSAEQELLECVKLCQGHLCYSRGFRNGCDVVSIVKLPSYVLNSSLQRWDLPPFPFGIVSLDINPSEDLLVLWAIETVAEPYPRARHSLHFVSLTTGHQHPDSIYPSIELSEFPSYIEDTALYTLGLRGGFVYTNFVFPAEPLNRYFTLVDWRSGARDLVLVGSEIVSGALIDESHAFLVVQCPEPSERPYELQVYKSIGRSHAGSRGRFTHIRTMELPKKFGGEVQTVWPGPCVVGPCHPSHPLKMDDMPWYRQYAPSDIASIAFFLRTSRRINILFFRTSALTCPGVEEGELPIYHPWAKWSIGNTAWCFREPYSWLAGICVQGEMAAVWGNPLLNSSRSLRLYDSTPSRMKGDEKGSGSSESRRLLEPPLSQRVCTLEGASGEVVRAMIDDERIVMVMKSVMGTGGVVERQIEVRSMVAEGVDTRLHP